MNDVNVISELNDVIENNTHWVGWFTVNSAADIHRFLWIYLHQTKTASSIRYDAPYNGKLVPLTYKQ